MIKFIKSLFKHRCKWETTHTNKWMHPTKQVCHQCGDVRELEVIGFGRCTWRHRDGSLDQTTYEWGEQ